MEKLLFDRSKYPCQKGDSGGGNALSDTQYAMGYFVMARYVNNEFGIYLY